ncbi:MAG: endonuclease/exonuclease/phosphatase family protein [Desulfobacterales bacterium]|nr:endonuclease/exonuclease/phosphatase family protein [Desulfobacterales bacterium]
MLIPNSPLIQSPVFFENAVIPDDFGLLCWNIHKENLKPGFLNQIRTWKKDHSLDLLLLQEARFSDRLTSLGGFPFVAAANLRLPFDYSGVITAANADPKTSRYHMTQAKEPLIFTPKNALITLYHFNDRSSLMVINLHAINFKSLAWYQWELARLFDIIRAHRGAMILAGDFNCWRKSRIKILDYFTDSLALDYALPRDETYVKKWFGFHLDRVYTRGLVVKDIHAVNCKNFSDHNPLIAMLERPS